MKRLLTFGLPILAMIAMAIYWYSEMNAEAPPRQISALEITGDACDLIAEKASMHLPEALPFQKMEKAARRARVLEMCMNDRVYVENPAWPAYAKPLAQKAAQAQQISYDEAYENLRRASMLKLKPANNEPLYWVAAKKPAKQ
ncbi:MAG TPA: hypothetical protein PLR90_03640 [Methylophilus sp.]|nr:hypothetical protein [Methylophilus sp.]HQQ32989.1 hypothetical protein [Methylophilus sp.]